MTAHDIPFHIPHMPIKGEQYVLEALRSGKHVNGPFTHAVADLLQERYGVLSVLPTHSATAALEMSAMLLATKHGASKAYLPSFTFSSTANAFVRAGYDLEFVDIDPTTMAAGLPEFQAADPPPGSVIMPVHYVGDLGDTDLIATWATERGLFMAEDAAQALGSSIGNRQAGTFGSMGAISFHYTKNVHASLGGALYVNDPDLVESSVYVWERGTNRQAFDRLSGLEVRNLFTPMPSRGTGNYHGYFVRLGTTADADALLLHMLDLGIHVYSHYVALHTSPLAIRMGIERSLPNTERWAECLLRLPLHTEMASDDAATVADEIINWLDARQ